ncbi:MAG: hypothetical protein A4E42_00218 [Methanoregulaceae archaeon PtaU1.Bin222]|nr:MAG: hypothetical protein A4E42_00218 [Methanoregulaceae archaeon PtaU1.Bin222]
MISSTSSCLADASSEGPGYREKSSSRIAFTFLSVVWAERIVRTRIW